MVISSSYYRAAIFGMAAGGYDMWWHLRFVELRVVRIWLLHCGVNFRNATPIQKISFESGEIHLRIKIATKLGQCITKLHMDERKG
ncbi:hypothetical protein BELL_0803g00030 [Botrytis elliptica]|uniref:Uncharacterized protein n=1 Tax=Botrytis elliptica TaxID=278938 RepID=A0A4Z1JI11_9HELO|nr:hypothetical protein BELL_0803g00030 [Botrytis elliptica]